MSTTRHRIALALAKADAARTPDERKRVAMAHLKMSEKARVGGVAFTQALAADIIAATKPRPGRS